MGSAIHPSPGHLQDQDPTWQCLIDGDEITVIPEDASPNPTPENNAFFCGTNVEDGEHLLAVNATSNGNPFKFDYLLYVPSANATLGKAIIQVDSTDPAFQYSGEWKEGVGAGMMTSTAGSNVTFDFIGVYSSSLSWPSFHRC